MDPSVVVAAKELLPSLDPAFRRGCHILHCGSPYLTPEFHQLVSHLTPDTAIACTCSVLDILAGPSLRYERSPGERAFCMFFCQHPVTLGPEAAWCAVIHEGAHYLSDQHPARDITDEQEAVKLWWQSMGNGNQAEHDRRWVRASAHLLFRAALIGNVGISSSMLFDQYVSADAVMNTLRPELLRAESIEQILESSEPRAFAQFADLWFDGRLPRESAPLSSATATRTTKRTRRRHFGLIGGQVVNYDDEDELNAALHPPRNQRVTTIS